MNRRLDRAVQHGYSFHIGETSYYLRKDYRNATMSDALFGLLLAAKEGLTQLVDVEQLRTHLL